MDVRNLQRMASFTTMDGSQIRELLAYRNSSIRNQSLAEACVGVGLTTAAHYHRQSEEIYYILAGRGRMRIGQETTDVAAGDAVAIPPGLEHQITNTGDTELVFLCCCAPAYEDAHTVLV